MNGNNQTVEELLDSENDLAEVYQRSKGTENPLQDLNEALNFAYRQAVEKGEDKYGGDQPAFGTFSLKQNSPSKQEAKFDLIYRPSQMTQAFARGPNYTDEPVDETKIAAIDLNRKLYSVDETTAEWLEEVPKSVIRDTKTVMEKLGFEQEEATG